MKLNRTRETVRCRHPGWTVLQIIKAVRFQIVGGAAEPLQRGHRFFLRVDIGLPSDKAPDRKRVVKGTSVSVRVDLGGRCIINNKNKKNTVSHVSIDRHRIYYIRVL